MKPLNTGGHSAYQQKVISGLKKYYPDAFSRFGPDIWAIIEKFYNLDLSKADSMMADRYSVFGPKPRNPSDMLRSMMVAIVLKKAGYTAWSRELKMNPLAAILSGFDPQDTPGVGTFYDFAGRMWLSKNDNFSPYVKPPKKKKVKEPKHSGDKAEPVEDLTVEELITNLKESPPSADQPYARLFSIFEKIFLNHSAELGLINLKALVASGDGTGVVSSARNRYRKTHTADKYYYSQPDTDCGYDSSRNRFYYGYNLYMITAADSKNDLPVFPLLNRASMHDSFGLCYTYAAMKAFLKDVGVSEILLDSAHDVMAIYQFCHENSITAIIDLNERNGVNFKYRDNYTVGKDGIPICEAGLKMIRDGTEKDRMRIKYRCPNVYHCDGIHCDHVCSDSPYGRVVHIPTKDNPRIFTIPPRDSKQWKTEYTKRTSSERCNKREKEDYMLESGRHRSSKLWYCRLYCIMMCQHLDAWAATFTSSAKQTLIAA